MTAHFSPFIKRYLIKGFNGYAKHSVKNQTINIAINIVITVLSYAARSWRDENGYTWFDTVPKLSKLAKKRERRAPYPLSWREQNIFFKELPDYLYKMALFKINTDTREQEGG